MKKTEQIAKILEDIITDNPQYDTLEIAETMYRIGFCDGVVSEQEKMLSQKNEEAKLPPYYGG